MRRSGQRDSHDGEEQAEVPVRQMPEGQWRLPRQADEARRWVFVVRRGAKRARVPHIVDEQPSFFSMNVEHAGHFLPILASSALVAGSASAVAWRHMCLRRSPAGTTLLHRTQMVASHVGHSPRRIARSIRRSSSTVAGRRESEPGSFSSSHATPSTRSPVRSPVSQLPLTPH